MSQYGDSESDTCSVRSIKIIDDFGDDVSIISRYEGSAVPTVLLKIALALLMIGACTGALVYSIINSENQSQNESYQSPKYFPIMTNQECENGTLTMTYRTGSDLGDEAGYNVTVYGSNWVQDDDKKRIFHRVGLGPRDWQYTYFVFENITFFQTKRFCTQMPMGYAEFLSGFGLEYITKYKEETFRISGHDQEIYVYEGEPPNNVTINGAHPSLIRGYAANDQPLAYGWELYFSHTTNFSLYKQEYWYPTMVHREPDYSIFDNLPEECLTN